MPIWGKKFIRGITKKKERKVTLKIPIINLI